MHRPTVYVTLFLVGIWIFGAIQPSAAIDNRCFTKSECAEQREKLGVIEAEKNEGFYQSDVTAEACGGLNKPGEDGKKTGEEIGFCLPVGQTITRISFGGRNQFANLAEFIQFMYSYGFVIAGVIAVLVIVVAGFQWTVSGGNTSTIQSAQNKIKGAFIGLILLALSYTILNTINPRTVNLRLPQIWLINPAELTPKYCSGTKSKVAFFAEQKENLTAKERNERSKNLVFFSQEDKPANCQNTYVVEDSGNLTCRGNYCEPKNGRPHVCGPSRADSTKDECYPGDMVAKIYRGPRLLPDIITEAWDTPPIDENETEIWGLCENGKLFEVPSTDRTEIVGSEYVILITFDDRDDIRKEGKDTCGSAENIKGYMWRFEMDENNDVTDEDHYVGRGGKDLGDEEAFKQTRYSSDITKYLYTLEEMEKGAITGELINAENIYDIDEVNPLDGPSGDDLRRQVYKDIGFK